MFCNFLLLIYYVGKQDPGYCTDEGLAESFNDAD